LDETVGFEPTINLIDGDEVYLELGSSFTPRATALDVEDGDLTDNIYISSDVDTSKSGEYTVRYSVVDSSGNSVYRDQIVYVGNFGDGYADDSGAYDDYEYDYSSDITIDDFKRLGIEMSVGGDLTHLYMSHIVESLEGIRIGQIGGIWGSKFGTLDPPNPKKF